MSVAKSYAQALFESAADFGATAELYDRIENEIDALLELIQKSPDLRVALLGPVITAKEKSAVLEAIAAKAGFHPAVLQFLQLLARKSRLPLLPRIRDAWAPVRSHAEGGLSGKVTSADPIRPEDVRGLGEAFSKKLGKKVTFQLAVDPALLAGIKVNVNGVTYDGTLQSQLQRLRDRLVTGNKI